MSDVQVNGSSVVNDGVAEIPLATAEQAGVGKAATANGVGIVNGYFTTVQATSNQLQQGSNQFRVVVPYNAHVATFYSLAKAAGDTTQASSSNAVGVYTDGAKDTIQHMLGVDELIAQREPNASTASKAYTAGEVFTWRGKLYKATTDIASGATLTVGTNCEQFKVAEAAVSGVSDVKVNGTSVVNAHGVANVSLASDNNVGVVQTAEIAGIGIRNDKLSVYPASIYYIRTGSSGYMPIVPSSQHQSTFFGLAKAAGDTTQAQGGNTVGTYTETAKSAISQMLSAPETVSGSTPSIVAKPGVQYICGEVSTIDITVPESGIIDVIFESGSTPAVLTVTPPTGVTVAWPDWFDPTALEANKVYEINVANGILATVMVW